MDAELLTNNLVLLYKEKEESVAKLMDKIGNSKAYTISEYRDIEVDVRKIAGLPQRDYREQTIFKKEMPLGFVEQGK